MRVLVTGAEGMLGEALAGSCPDEVELLATDMAQLDITSQESIGRAMQLMRPQAVLNAAAFTSVDACETEELRALEVNGQGAGLLAKACAVADVPLMQISTDYVFDGTIPAPGMYSEDDQTRPLSAYGRTKLAGEVAVRDAHAAHWIVRTQWLYGLGGKNFVETMLRLGAQGGPLTVVDDQVGCPTSTADLAPLLWRVITRRPPYGTYHAVNSGSCSWYDFAREIFRQADLPVTIAPIDSSRLGLPAPRPARSVLCTARLRAALHVDIPVWQDALRRYLLRRSSREAHVS